MGRISSRFKELKKSGEKALVTFITAGDPDIATTEEMILEMERAGADIIELGVPFSDPMADGPTIQLSSERALASGTTLPKILDMVRSVRRRSAIPIILMGYYNPIFIYGVGRFFADAAAAGVDGLLLVDLPPEEAADCLRAARSNGLDMILLLTPTSDEARINRVVKLASGFIYYVSVTGVTGARKDVSGSVSGAVDEIKGKTAIPIVVGFGISDAEQAANVAAVADGVVVGSAIVRLFEENSGDLLKTKVRELVSSLKEGANRASS